MEVGLFERWDGLKVGMAKEEGWVGCGMDSGDEMVWVLDGLVFKDGMK